MDYIIIHFEPQLHFCKALLCNIFYIAFSRIRGSSGEDFNYTESGELRELEVASSACMEGHLSGPNASVPTKLLLTETNYFIVYFVQYSFIISENGLPVIKQSVGEISDRDKYYIENQTKYGSRCLLFISKTTHHRVIQTR